MPSDKGYWGIVSDGYGFIHSISRTRTGSIKGFAGPEEGYAKRWRKIKRWEVRPHVVRVTVTWGEPEAKKQMKKG